MKKALPKTLSMNSPTTKRIPISAALDIETLHSVACLNKQNSYIDPKSGYTVFTSHFHQKRGVCCGNKCRHCPFDHINVKHKESN
jgi:hypothetical protein